MKILYLSCHSVLEFDELAMLTELDDVASATEEKLNPEVFSMGAYSNPTQAGDFMRNVIPRGKFYPELYQIAMQCDKDRLHPELVEWADVIISMHNSKIPGVKAEQPWIVNNWQLFQEKKKKVVWRSIGQCTPSIESELGRYRALGLKIVRHSPIEDKIPNYAGADAIIRFAKDPDEFQGWTGHKKQVISIIQSFMKRGDHLGYSYYDKITDGFDRKVFGTENQNLGKVFGGVPTYEELKRILQESRVFYYYGTIPVPYTLSFIEAMMTGIPMVCAGPKLRTTRPYEWEHYEIPQIITNGVNGFWSDDVNELRGYIKSLMEDDELAIRIGEAGRKTAIELFDRTQVMRQWGDFLRRL